MAQVLEVAVKKGEDPWFAWECHVYQAGFRISCTTLSDQQMALWCSEMLPCESYVTESRWQGLLLDTPNYRGTAIRRVWKFQKQEHAANFQLAWG